LPRLRSVSGQIGVLLFSFAFLVGFFLFLHRGFCRIRDEIEMCDSKAHHGLYLCSLWLFKIASRIGTEEKMRIGQAANELCGWEEAG
jgi:hypothetical protein